MKLALALSFLLALPAGIAGWLTWLGTRAERMLENERAAHGALHQLWTLQLLLHRDDQDGNGVSDYWTADIAGLQKFFPEHAAFIAEIVAADPARPGARPYRGFWFAPMAKDDAGQPFGPRHTARFGFCAYPESYRVSGVYTYIATDDRVTKRDLEGASVLQRPPDRELRTLWPVCISG